MLARPEIHLPSPGEIIEYGRPRRRHLRLLPQPQMAAAFDHNLGQNVTTNAGGNVTLTTTAAATANTRVVVVVTYWTVDAVNNHTSGVSIGGTAATQDLKFLNSNGADTIEIWSAPMPAGLAISSSITVTFGISTAGGEQVGALSISGVDMTNGGGVDITGNGSGSGTSWASGSATAIVGGIAVGGAGNEATATTTPASATTGTLVHDGYLSSAGQGFATAYLVVSAGNNGQVAGTFNSTSTVTTGGVVIYKVAGGGGGGTAAFIPRRLPMAV